MPVNVMNYFSLKEQATIRKYESLRRRIWREERKKKTRKEFKKIVGEVKKELKEKEELK